MQGLVHWLSAAVKENAGGCDPASVGDSAGGSDPASFVRRADMSFKLQEAEFSGVVDARSSAFQVPAVIVDCRVKKVKTFHKLVGFAIDRERGGMWCEAIGPLPVLQGLLDRMNRGKLVMFSKLCIKKSAYHSGGRYLDLSAKSGTTVSGLPPVHAAYKDLQDALRDGYACNSKIALLEGMRRGQKADIVGKVIDVTVKGLKDGNVSWQTRFIL